MNVDNDCDDYRGQAWAGPGSFSCTCSKTSPRCHDIIIGSLLSMVGITSLIIVNMYYHRGAWGASAEEGRRAAAVTPSQPFTAASPRLQPLNAALAEAVPSQRSDASVYADVVVDAAYNQKVGGGHHQVGARCPPRGARPAPSARLGSLL